MKMGPFCNEYRQYQSLDGIGVLGLTLRVVSKTKDPIIQYLSNIYTPNPISKVGMELGETISSEEELGGARVVGKRGESS